MGETLYRYTTNGEGVYSAGKRLLPHELIDETGEARKWLPKPDLGRGDFRFFMTENGREKYEETLLPVHKKYLSNIQLEKTSRSDVQKQGKIVYEDTWQVVIKPNA